MTIRVVKISGYHPAYYEELSEDITDAIILVFECVPEQYRKVCEWFWQNKKNALPVYRYVIPCVDENDKDVMQLLKNNTDTAKSIIDLGDFSDYNIPMVKFKGTFESWPEKYCYKLREIKIDRISADFGVEKWASIADNSLLGLYREGFCCSEIWPQPTNNCISGFYRDGYCAERSLLLPELSSGISETQKEMISMMEEGETSVAMILNRVSIKLNLGMALCEQQLHWLCTGNLKFAERRGKSIILISPLPDACIPLRLVNGDFPISLKKACVALSNALRKKAKFEEIDFLPPSCGSYLFKPIGTEYVTYCKVDESTDDVILPYGVSPFNLTGEYVEVSESTVDGKIKGAMVDPDGPEWFIHLSRRVCVIDEDTGVIKVFPKLSDYVKVWVERYKTRAVINRPKTVASENIRRMFLMAQFMSEREHRNRNLFKDLTKSEKRASLAAQYGEEHVTMLMKIPYADIGPEAMDPIEASIPYIARAPRGIKRARLGEYYNATDELIEEIENIYKV